MDALPARPLGSCGGEGARGIAVVGVEQRELQIHVHTVGGRELVHRLHDGLLPVGEVGLPRHPVQVGERDDELGGGVAGDDVGVAGDRELVIAARPRDLGEPGEVRHVRRIEVEPAPVPLAGRPHVAGTERQLAELVRGPGGVRGRPGRVERHPHRALRAADVADELAGVGDACVRGEVGPGVHHRLEGVERAVVSAQLDQRVPDHAVGVGRVRIERRGVTALSERGREVVSRQIQDPEPQRALDVVVPVEADRSGEHTLRLRVPGRVARDPGLRDVRESERGVAAPVLRQGLQAVLQRGDRAVQRPRGDRGDQQRGRGGGPSGNLRRLPGGADERERARHEQRDGHRRRRHRLADRPHPRAPRRSGGAGARPKGRAAGPPRRSVSEDPRPNPSAGTRRRGTPC